MKLLLTIIGIALMLSANDGKAFANTLTVTPNYDGTVMMVADEGVDGVERIDLTVSYGGKFSDPRPIVSGGGFSLEQMLRDSSAGILKLVITRDEPDAAFITILDFDTKPGDQPCAINFVAAAYTYANGKQASPRVILLPPTEPPKKPDPSPDADSTSPKSQQGGAAAATAGQAVDTVNPSSSTSRGIIRTFENKGGGSSTSVSVKDTALSGADMNPLDYRVCPDILQRFRDYKGDKSLGSLISLFNYHNPCAFRQTPAVAISDGASKVAVTIELEPDQQNAPNFGLSGARLISLWRDTDSVWTIELLPNEAEHDVVLYVINGRVLRRIPLVVAPPLALYLKSLTPGEKLSPLLEFTVAANYLASKGQTESKSGPASQTAALPILR